MMSRAATRRALMGGIIGAGAAAGLPAPGAGQMHVDRFGKTLSGRASMNLPLLV